MGKEEVYYLAVKLKSTKTCRRLEKGVEVEIYEVGVAPRLGRDAAPWLGRGQSAPTGACLARPTGLNHKQVY